MICLPEALRSRWPVFEEDEITAVAEVLRSGRVNALHHGERCAEFESAFAQACQMPFAIALSNGTVALELALQALGVGPGDEVIVPARSFFASASCVVAVGAKPVFADVQLHSQNIDPISVERLVNSRTRAIIVVHLAGWPCDMTALRTICEKRELWLVEDCAQAHGATFAGEPVGSFGDAAAFSFCTDKIISTGGEGGMLLLKAREAYETAWSIKDHGKRCDRIGAQHGPIGTFQWLHERFGTNMRMTEMQAAIGLLQLSKLSERVEARRRNAQASRTVLSAVPGVIVNSPPPQFGHAYYKFYARLDPTAFDLPVERDRICAEALARGVTCGSGSCPEIYLEDACKAAGLGPPERLPNARALGESSFMLQCDHTLTKEGSSAAAEIVADVITELDAQRAAA